MGCFKIMFLISAQPARRSISANIINLKFFNGYSEQTLHNFGRFEVQTCWIPIKFCNSNKWPNSNMHSMIGNGENEKKVPDLQEYKFKLRNWFYQEHWKEQKICIWTALTLELLPKITYKRILWERDKHELFASIKYLKKSLEPPFSKTHLNNLK